MITVSAAGTLADLVAPAPAADPASAEAFAAHLDAATADSGSAGTAPADAPDVEEAAPTPTVDADAALTAELAILLGAVATPSVPAAEEAPDADPAGDAPDGAPDQAVDVEVPAPAVPAPAVVGTGRAATPESDLATAVPVAATHPEDETEGTPDDPPTAAGPSAERDAAVPLVAVAPAAGATAIPVSEVADAARADSPIATPVGSVPPAPASARAVEADRPTSQAAVPDAAATAPSATTPPASAPAVPATPVASAAPAPAAVPIVAPTVAGATPIEAPAPVAPATPVAPPALVDQLRAPIASVRALPEGSHVVTVHVTPDELGPVTVRAVVHQGALDVQLAATTDAARDALRSLLPDLRRDLATGAPGTTQLQLADGLADRATDRQTGDGRSADDRAPDQRRDARPDVAAESGMPASRPVRTGHTALDVLA